MTDTHAMLDLIARETARILAEKGEAAAPVTADTAFLDGPLPFDSLDLATLIVALEGVTGKDPFRQGFRQFNTAGELAALYAAA
ncbi:acyl carrier protein [Niveispirillum sp. KHB5.9]|uniref:acyl carrier protein n=1 Tax=Niveispirillum sp. KHB5.9 TaxID=3400269 RepID=UPI003A87E7CD